MNPPAPTGELEIYRGASGLDLDAVERELKALWKQASAEHASEGRAPVTRVGTLNLLALVPESTIGETALGEMLEVTADHPGRIFLLETTPERGTLRAEVSAHCHLRGGGGQVCSEVIRVWIGEPVAPRLHSVVAPLLIPDLPVVLWLPGDPRQVDPPENLLGLVDRVLLDSHRVPASAAHFRTLQRWRGAVRLGISDLAWQRLARWRSLVAQLLQEEWTEAAPADLSAIEIEYVEGEEGQACGRAEALYFAAWAAARLGYPPPSNAFDPVSGERWRAERDDGASLEAHFRPVPRRAQVAGDLHRIRVRTASGAVHEIARGSEYCTARLHVTGGRSGATPTEVDLRTRGRVDLMRAALEQRRPDPLLAEALDWLLEAIAGAA